MVLFDFTVEKSVTAWSASEGLGHSSEMDDAVFYSETGGLLNFDSSEGIHFIFVE